MAEELVVKADLLEGTMSRPSSLKRGDEAGTEGIGTDAIRLPRLAIAQGLSEQMMPDSSLYIPNLKLFDMFNDLTGEVYGRGPITFVPVRRDVRRIEFVPRNEGGGIRDMNVPAGDERLQWTSNSRGERTPPAATMFDEYIVMLLIPSMAPEPIVISIKHTNKFNRRAIGALNTFIKLRHAPIYSGLYTVQCVSEKNDKGTFGVPVFKNKGFLDLEKNTFHRALYDNFKQFADSLEGKEIAISREPGDEDFDPES